MNEQMSLNIESEESTQDPNVVTPKAESKADEKKELSVEEKRAAHEAAEAKRKEEWEAAKKAKKERRQQEIDAVNAMSADQLASGAKERLGIHVERLTRRNMMLEVTAYVQDLCDKDPEFARQCMMPHKSMANCFRRINKNALAYLMETAKMFGAEGSRQLSAEDIEDLRKKGVDIPPMATGVRATAGGVGFGTGGICCASGDVPDDLCFAWAEEYFRDPDAPEDKEPEEEFKAKPFIGGSSAKKKSDKDKGKGKTKATATASASKETAPAPKTVSAPKKKQEDEQISLFDLTASQDEPASTDKPMENPLPAPVIEPAPAPAVETAPEPPKEVEKPKVKENIVSLNDKRIRDALETPITFSSLAGMPLKAMIDKFAGDTEKIVKNLEYIAHRKLITPADQKLADAANTILELCYRNVECAA